MAKTEVSVGWATLIISDGKIDILVKGVDPATYATLQRWERGNAADTLKGNCFTISKAGRKTSDTGHEIPA